MSDRKAQEQLTAAQVEKSEAASEYCPACSRRLEARSCKFVCPSCGYYMSCSDYY
jgi:predicted RNA-binding Zn-ribbon protein involved in translation (DUF1610 family)